MIIFTGINENNLADLGKFIEANALFGVAVEITPETLGEHLVPFARRYGANFIIRASTWENGLDELFAQKDFAGLAATLRNGSFKIAVALDNEERILHAIHIANECPQHEVMLLDTGSLALRFLAMEKVEAIRATPEEFANIQPLGNYQNRYDTVVDFETLRKFKWA